ncbi:MULTISPECIES: LysE family translocator [Pseudonocardia]|uniref:Leucine efflux protein n=2 Tax=Pseudonocardia TaxID=1847 RepID=A0A1Y2MQZ6_PSEAH|nr:MULTISPECIES: LysE family translocator [Pseudonocardia]OSY37389.1 Leucine efflux protein [Pseudonocardia autotrophica]TDN77285.1 threonine/homoserine/homoserine lactone efflux protein [Pseudonocardia autotrophica]BBG01305.1 threonine transporter RhtB [Pseudonocardia autotrophica]GEC26032.1 threonine transporter RhtB [Pseudonocardia saturnea]
MSGTALATWTVVALLGVMTPGIDTKLVLRHTILGGGRSGLAVVGGIAAGCLVWAGASLAGLTALLAASTVAYDIVRIAGACYLVWLGLSAIWKTLPRNRTATGDRLDAVDVNGLTVRSGLRAGFFTNLLNPKVGVFYISLLPQFMPVGPAATAWGALLVAIHLAVSFVWYPALIAIAARVRGVLLRDRVRAGLERVTAVVLIGVGVRLATESR